MTYKLAASARLVKCNSFSPLLNSGYLRLYQGAEPDPDSPIGTETLLAELTYGSTAYQAATDDGTASNTVANPILQDASADATGTAQFFRQYQTDGITVVGQGSITVTGGGGDMEMATTVNVIVGGTVVASSDIHTQPSS